MADADIKDRSAGAITGAAVHAGAGAQVIAQRPLKPVADEVQYSFIFVGRTMKQDTGGSASSHVQRMFLIAVDNASGSWAPVVRSAQIGGDNGTLADPVWSFDVVGDVLTASCTAATTGANAISCGFFIGVGFELTGLTIG